ncbi:MAG: hypothetical protein Tsb006_2300 [Rickettsiaceae bacterium]
MANHSSTKKAIRKTVRSTAINKNRKSRIKTYIKKVLLAVESGSVEEAKKSLVEAQSEIMKGAATRLIKKNTAARRVSRLAHLVKGISLKAEANNSVEIDATADKTKNPAPKAKKAASTTKKTVAKKVVASETKK